MLRLDRAAATAWADCSVVLHDMRIANLTGCGLDGSCSNSQGPSRQPNKLFTTQLSGDIIRDAAMIGLHAIYQSILGR